MPEIGIDCCSPRLSKEGWLEKQRKPVSQGPWPPSCVLAGMESTPRAATALGHSWASEQWDGTRQPCVHIVTFTWHPRCNQGVRPLELTWNRAALWLMSWGQTHTQNTRSSRRDQVKLPSFSPFLLQTMCLPSLFFPTPWLRSLGPNLQNVVLISFFHSTQCPQDKVQVPQVRFKGPYNLDPLPMLPPQLSLLPSTSSHPSWSSLSILSATSLESPAPVPLLMLTPPLELETAQQQVLYLLAMRTWANYFFKPLLLPLENRDMLCLTGLL